MDDNLAEVHQHPAAGRVTFNLRAFATMFFVRGLVQRVGQRVELALAGAGADDEVVGEDRVPLDVEQDDVLGLFVFEGVYE
jgi:hypothetical protein